MNDTAKSSTTSSDSDQHERLHKDNPSLEPTRTKLLSSDPNALENLFMWDHFAEVVSPLLEPETDSGITIIDELLDELGCLSGGTVSNAKMRVLLSSFIVQSRRLQERIKLKGGQMIIGWPHDEAYWRVRSKVGYKIAIKLRNALITHGWITHKVGATINLYEGEGNCHGYLIADFVPSKGDDINFQSSDMVYATKSSALKTKVVNEEIDQRTKALWDLWKQTPLTHDNQKMWQAQRRFSDKAFTRGGRFYGAWSNMKQTERLKCTIDGQPVAEVDVSGMYPTLLCSISGHIPFATRFKDPYAVEGIHRNEVKAVLGSAIGGGTSQQRTPTKMIKDARISQNRLSDIRKVIISKYKCLEVLQKGVMDSEALAIHETEIMMRLVERLQRPIFILHDCLVCQKDEALSIGSELQKEYVSYCCEMGWTPIAPAFSIERDGVEKYLVSGHRNPHEIRL